MFLDGQVEGIATATTQKEYPVSKAADVYNVHFGPDLVNAAGFTLFLTTLDTAADIRTAMNAGIFK